MHPVYQLALSATIFTVLCTGGTPRAATAATYHVATNGNDANQGTESQPFRTIRQGVSVLRPNDTLYIRQGTYDEGVNAQSMTIPSGTSWSNAITISGYPDETVTLRGSVGSVVDISLGANASYLIFENLILDAAARHGGTGFFVGPGSHHIRLINSEVKNASEMNIQFADGAEYNEVINCSIHDAAVHGLYISSSNNLFDGNQVYNNGWYGYHLYVSSDRTVNNNVIRNSEIYGNGSMRDSFGVIVGSGDNNVVHDNIVRNNTGGILVAYRNPSDTQVYSNTVHDNSGVGMYILPGSINTTVEQNSVYSNQQNIIDLGTGTILSDNTE
jgi:parallel beta-helix repeat protein